MVLANEVLPLPPPLLENPPRRYQGQEADQERPRDYGTAQAVPLVAEPKAANQERDRIRIGGRAACSGRIAEARWGWLLLFLRRRV